MAIVQLKKLTFCGLIEDKARILAQLQLLGGLHLIPLAAIARDADSGRMQQAERVVEALKYLNSCPNKRHQLKSFKKSAKQVDLGQVVDEALKIKSKTRELRDRYDAVQKRIHELQPWGDFHLPKEGLLASQRLWFYIVPKRLMSKMQACEQVWQTVYQDNLHCYVVVISEQEPAEYALPVARTHTGAIPLSELETQAGELELALEDLQAQRESLTRWITLITLQFNETQDQDALKQAQTMTRDEAGVFAIQGWLPAELVERYIDFAEREQLALLIEEAAAEEHPPTLLSNPPALAGGEDLVSFYQTPNYRGWDPSATVFFSFSLFFALILSDAGYASVFAAFLAFKWRNLGKDGKGRRIRVLATCAIGLSLLWGVLCGSYFGYEPEAGSGLSRLQQFSLNDFDGMMRLTVGIGVVHIALANLIKAWQWRASLKALAPLGWICLGIGGFCYWLSTSQNSALLQTAGQTGMGFGAVLLILFSSDRPIERWTDWLWRLVGGIESLVNITKLFGDVLSYMRLFALGLASASLALTFNRLAEEVIHNFPGAGLALGILILLLGHSLNLLLCILSGLVHGLRLNFIEFYNWSVSDEGYPFKAFSKKGVRS